MSLLDRYMRRYHPRRYLLRQLFNEPYFRR